MTIGGSRWLFLAAAAALPPPQAAVVVCWVLDGSAVTAVVGVLLWFGVQLSEGLRGPVNLTMGNANFAASYAGITASNPPGLALGADMKALW